jgi:hypothetical protein
LKFPAAKEEILLTGRGLRHALINAYLWCRKSAFSATWRELINRVAVKAGVSGESKE